jgi:hypothetical protein
VGWREYSRSQVTGFEGQVTHAPFPGAWLTGGRWAPRTRRSRVGHSSLTTRIFTTANSLAFGVSLSAMETSKLDRGSTSKVVSNSSKRGLCGSGLDHWVLAAGLSAQTVNPPVDPVRTVVGRLELDRPCILLFEPDPEVNL